MTRHGLTEEAIQRAVFSHLRVRATPGVVAFHVPNGGYRRPVEAARLKGLGVRPGVPDVVAVHRGQVYAIEFKTEYGRATNSQLQAIEDIRAVVMLRFAMASIARSRRSKGGVCCGAAPVGSPPIWENDHADR
jgi:hypothetical protein